MCQGLSQFSGFLHHLVMAKLVTRSIRFNLCCLHARMNDPCDIENTSVINPVIYVYIEWCCKCVIVSFLTRFSVT